MQILHELVAVRREPSASMSLGEILREDGAKAMIAKSEDLPGMKLLSHESLAENMQIRIRKGVFSLRILRGLFDFLSGFGCMAASPVPYHAPTDQKERNTS